MDKIETQFLTFFKNFAASRPGLAYLVTSRYRPTSKGSYHAIPEMAMDIIFNTNGDYSSLKTYEDFFLFLYANKWPGGCGIDNTERNGNVHVHLDARNLDGKPKYFFIEDYGQHKIPFKGDPAELVNFRDAVNAELLKKK